MLIRSVCLVAVALVCSVLTVSTVRGSEHPLGDRATLIVGGSSVSIADYPYQVALVQAANDDSFQGQFCGGTLVDARWVVTAAHCVEGANTDEPDEISVAVGKTRLTQMGPGDRYPVEAIYSHPAYNDVGNGSVTNDIALLLLALPVPPTVGTPVPWLSDSTLPGNGTPIISSGWGSTDHKTAGPFTDSLMAVTVYVDGNPYDSYFTCGSDGSFESATRLCIDSPDRKGTCSGDSGGPNVIEVSGIKYLAGVTSYGLMDSEGYCAKFQNVLARVSTYVDWIEFYVGTFRPVTPNAPAFWSPGIVPKARAQYEACPAVATIPSAGFTDLDSVDVDCIFYYGITKGKTTTTYSPDDPVTRWEMALFLTRMAHVAGVPLGDGSDQGFTDISGESAEIQVAINQIRQVGVTIGKTATTFAPTSDVTREEMALFIERFLSVANAGPGGANDLVVDDDHERSSGVGVALALTDPSLIVTNYTDIDSGATYTIDSSTTHEGRNAIAHLWHMGVTSDDSSTARSYSTVYRPHEAMTRLEMAKFLARALDHTNARPKGVTLQAAQYESDGEKRVLWAGMTWPTLSVSFRDGDFMPLAGAPIDVFYYEIPEEGERFDFTTAGLCNPALDGPVAATNAGNKCSTDFNDQITDVDGNAVPTVGAIPMGKTWNIYAWTAALNTVYDKNLHQDDASRLDITTTETIRDTAEDYSFASLYNQNFDGIDLSGSSFANALITESIFSNSLLIGANFSNASGTGVLFTNAALPAADFIGATLTGAHFGGADLVGANFTNSVARGSIYTQAILQHAKFADSDLQQSDLTYMRATGADFTGADLSQTLLTGANLAEANLTRASLDYATALWGTNFRNANLEAASAINAVLPGAVLDHADLSGGDFTGVKLPGATLVSADLSDASMAGADLDWSAMQAANLSGAELTGANLKGVNLAKANLAGTNLSGTNFCWVDEEGVNFENAHLEEANLAGANLSGANLCDANLDRADLAGANLSGANLTGATLTMVDLGGANLAGVDLRQANLADANLTGANLAGAILSGVNVSGASLANVTADSATRWPDLVGANLADANLVGVNLSGVDLRQASLAGVDLSEANLEWANLADANLTGANLSGAYFWGATLGGANLAGANLSGPNLNNVQLTTARADSSTVWPAGFNPEAAGVILED